MDNNKKNKTTTLSQQLSSKTPQKMVERGKINTSNTEIHDH